ncbi:E3 ubiquitin-protein ligase RNF170-like isoform X2 [Salvia hispanica]|uniref:E3 ubiquitin-protein ligase RNF170-like isoform X2 n=1 Tax=Salvia hispanica TaxID=49212 RepID=UPI0020096F8D|nr:E3 ubiquitin-protein ligase RNF170-like isoform X2 [Salvia hispanica]
MKMEMGGPENVEKGKNVGGGYCSRDFPPEDDCCAICFDDFNFPSKTSCGHWFCSGCILELWRYRPDSKQCKCPICGCLILNLVMQSSMLIQPGEEVGKIVRDIQLYNNTNLGGFSGLLMKAAGLPLLIRRGLWENLNITMLEYLCNSMHKIGLLLGVVYEVFELQFFPNGGIGIAVWFDLCIYGLVVFILWDFIWQRWMVVFRRLL